MYFQVSVTSSDDLLLGEGAGTHVQLEIYALLLDRKGESRELFLHLLFFKCLQLKMILMSKLRIWGWRILIPFTSSFKTWVFLPASLVILRCCLQFL